MKYILTVGYLGKTTFLSKDKSTSVSKTEKEEPVKTLKVIFDKFGVKEINCKVDKDLIEHLILCKKNERKEELSLTLESLNGKVRVEDLLKKLSKIKEISDTLPMVFDLDSEDVEIGVVDCEDTIQIVSIDHKFLLELKEQFETEKRCKPFGFHDISLEELKIFKI